MVGLEVSPWAPKSATLQRCAQIIRSLEASVCTLCSFSWCSHLLEAKAANLASCKTHIPFISAFVHFSSHTLLRSQCRAGQGSCWRSNFSFWGKKQLQGFLQNFWFRLWIYYSQLSDLFTLSGVVQKTQPCLFSFFVPHLVNNFFTICKPINGYEKSRKVKITSIPPLGVQWLSLFYILPSHFFH